MKHPRAIKTGTVLAAAAVLVLILFIVLCVAWFSESGEPSIEFVEFQEYPDPHVGGRAVFRMVNASSRSFVFHGYSETQPLYFQDEWNGTEWVQGTGGFWCGTGVEYQTLAAHTATEFTTFIPEPEYPQDQYRIGIRFQPGSANTWLSRFILNMVQEVKFRIDPDAPPPEPIWSEPFSVPGWTPHGPLVHDKPLPPVMVTHPAAQLPP